MAEPRYEEWAPYIVIAGVFFLVAVVVWVVAVLLRGWRRLMDE
jgi:hypothetical protein